MLPIGSTTPPGMCLIMHTACDGTLYGSSARRNPIHSVCHCDDGPVSAALAMFVELPVVAPAASRVLPSDSVTDQ